VSQYLNEVHTDKYWIINAADALTYDKQKFFNGRVSDFHWKD
jgi:hypothetical protein